MNRTNYRALALLAAFLIGASTANLSAATFSDDNWISMGGIPGVEGWNFEVHATAVDAFGNLYIGGQFTIAGQIFATNIAKWDGSQWSALGSGINGDVVALLVSGSNLYAGGLFTTAGGVSATNIAQWNGTNWSALGLGMDGEVRALAVSKKAAGSDLSIKHWLTRNRRSADSGAIESAKALGQIGCAGDPGIAKLEPQCLMDKSDPKNMSKSE